MKQVSSSRPGHSSKNKFKRKFADQFSTIIKKKKILDENVYFLNNLSNKGLSKVSNKCYIYSFLMRILKPHQVEGKDYSL